MIDAQKKKEVQKYLVKALNLLDEIQDRTQDELCVISDLVEVLHHIYDLQIDTD